MYLRRIIVGTKGVSNLEVSAWQTVRASVKKTGSVRVLLGGCKFEVFAHCPGNGGIDSAAQEAAETEYKFRSSGHMRKS